MAESTRRDREETGLLNLNREMDWAAERGRVNESFLEGCLESLDRSGPEPGPDHWLTLARLTELTLWLAGGYADAGLFRETGDLLFNPRRKYLVRKKSLEFVELQRHRPISQTAQELGLAPEGSLDVIKEEFRLVIEKKALMPELNDRLEAQPFPSGPYLRSVEARLVRISATLCYQSTLSRPEGMDLEEYLSLLPRDRRERAESQLCRFGLDLYRSYGGRLALGVEDLRPLPGPGGPWPEWTGPDELRLGPTELPARSTVLERTAPSAPESGGQSPCLPTEGS